MNQESLTIKYNSKTGLFELYKNTRKLTNLDYEDAKTTCIKLV